MADYREIQSRHIEILFELHKVGAVISTVLGVTHSDIMIPEEKTSAAMVVPRGLT